MCVVVFVVRRYTPERGGGWVMYAHAGMGGADPHPKSLNLDGGDDTRPKRGIGFMPLLTRR